MGDLCAGVGGYGVRCGRVPLSFGEIYAEFYLLLVVIVHALAQFHQLMFNCL